MKVKAFFDVVNLKNTTTGININTFAAGWFAMGK